MTEPGNQELEVAKCLKLLIDRSRDEPVRLATKLNVILEHMKSTGKENSLSFQVISMTMETLVNQHGLVIEPLTSAQHPSSPRPQGSSTLHAIGSSQAACAVNSMPDMTEMDSTKTDDLDFSHQPITPSRK